MLWIVVHCFTLPFHVQPKQYRKCSCVFLRFEIKNNFRGGSATNGATAFNLYIGLEGTTQESVPQVKLGQTLNLRLFGVVFDKNNGRSRKLVKQLSIKQLREKENSQGQLNTIKIKNITS